MIPKIIHQTWKTSNIPNEWKNATDSCRGFNKDFKYILWTDKTMDIFVKQNYPGFYKLYRSYKYNIQRCDAFRYFLLYKYGGVYLDMDIVCRQKLNGFIHYDFVVAQSSNISTSFTNSFFMIVPNHPFFKYCINNLPQTINNYKHFGKHLHVMNSTGPIFLNKMLNSYGKIKNTYILTKEEFAGDCNICNESVCTGGTYFKHIKGQSWNEADSLFFNYMLCNKDNIVKLILFFIIMFFVFEHFKNQKIDVTKIKINY